MEVVVVEQDFEAVGGTRLERVLGDPRVHLSEKNLTGDEAFVGADDAAAIGCVVISNAKAALLHRAYELLLGYRREHAQEVGEQR
jgi:hypothetical protein